MAKWFAAACYQVENGEAKKKPHKRKDIKRRIIQTPPEFPDRVEEKITLTSLESVTLKRTFADGGFLFSLARKK